MDLRVRVFSLFMSPLLASASLMAQEPPADEGPRADEVKRE